MSSVGYVRDDGVWMKEMAPHCFEASTRPPELPGFVATRKPRRYRFPGSLGFPSYRGPRVALGARDTRFDDGPFGGAIARMQIDRDREDGAPERPASRPAGARECPLGRWLALASTGSPEQRQRWSEAAESYAAWSQSRGSLGWGAELCAIDDLGLVADDDADPDEKIENPTFKPAQRYTPEGRWLGTRRLKRAAPTHIRTNVPPRGYDARAVARLDAKKLYHKAQKALSAPIVKGRKARLSDLANWTVLDGRSLSEIAVTLGYSDQAKYGRKLVIQALKSALTIISSLAGVSTTPYNSSRAVMYRKSFSSSYQKLQRTVPRQASNEAAELGGGAIFSRISETKT